MFNIQNKPYFEWPRPMGGNSVARNSKLMCSYRKDHGHRTETVKPLSNFWKGYFQRATWPSILKAPRRRKKMMMKRQANRLVTGVIDAIHASTCREIIIKNAIRVHSRGLNV